MSPIPGKPSVSLRGLRTFCSAARHLSFTSAGEELFITASAVSHQIKSLEQELDKILFDRNGRELSLTPVGKSLFDDVNPLIEKLDQVTADYRTAPLRTSISLSVQPFFASEFFVPRLSEFTRQHPEIDIQVSTSDESSERHPAEADMSIRLFSSAPTNMASGLLFPLRLVPAGSPDFLKNMVVEKKKIVSDFPIIVHESRPKAWSRWADVSGITLPESSKVVQLDSMIAVVRAAERGIGAALVPVPIADLWFKQGSIVKLFRKELVDDVSYYLVWDEDKTDDEKITDLRNWILENFADAG